MNKLNSNKKNVIASNFKDSVKKAEPYEEAVINFYSNIGETIDVRHDKKYQKQDVDLLFKRATAKEYTKIEIKCDFWIGENIKNGFQPRVAFEIKANQKSNGAYERGYILKTETDILDIFDVENAVLYHFDLQKCKDYIGVGEKDGNKLLHNILRYRLQCTQNDESGVITDTFSLLIPIADLKDAGALLGTSQLEKISMSSELKNVPKTATPLF